MTNGFQVNILCSGLELSGVEHPPQFMSTDAHFWVKIGFKISIPGQNFKHFGSWIASSFRSIPTLTLLLYDFPSTISGLRYSWVPTGDVAHSCGCNSLYRPQIILLSYTCTSLLWVCLSHTAHTFRLLRIGTQQKVHYFVIKYTIEWCCNSNIKR